MRVNKHIKETLLQISKKSIDYANNPDMEYKYLKRMIKQFEKLSEDEKLYLVKQILEEIRYKNIITDPDNVIALHNIKLRSHTYVFILFVIGGIIMSALLRTNSAINNLLDVFSKIVTVLSL